MRSSRVWGPVVGLVVLLLALALIRGFGSAGDGAAGDRSAGDRSASGGAAPGPSAVRTATGTATGRSSGSSRSGSWAAGMRTCALSALPSEAQETVRLIHRGGPFRYPRNDGVTFENREGLLARRASGYYREYTVVTPGSSDRGTRRVITGGNPATDPPEWYYTGDHYQSFCAITDA